MKKRKPKPGSAAELSELYPPTRTVEVRVERVETGADGAKLIHDQETVCVRPLAIMQIGAVAEALAPIEKAIGATPNLFALAAKHPKDVMRAVAAAIDWHPTRVGKIYAPDFVTLVYAIMEINGDFFAQLLGPLAFVQSAMKAAERGAGETPSDSFAATDTPTRKDTH